MNEQKIRIKAATRDLQLARKHSELIIGGTTEGAASLGYDGMRNLYTLWSGIGNGILAHGSADVVKPVLAGLYRVA